MLLLLTHCFLLLLTSCASNAPIKGLGALPADSTAKECGKLEVVVDYGETCYSVKGEPAVRERDWKLLTQDDQTAAVEFFAENIEGALVYILYSVDAVAGVMVVGGGVWWRRVVYYKWYYCTVFAGAVVPEILRHLALSESIGGRIRYCWCQLAETPLDDVSATTCNIPFATPR